MEFAWGGFVDISMNRAPDFGRLGPHRNLYYLQGFSGHGLALTGLAGQMVAQAIRGDASRFDTFARIRHHNFPGGPTLRMPAPGAGHGLVPPQGRSRMTRPSQRPLVLLPACNRQLGLHPFHIAGHKYVDAVRLAGCQPLVVPGASAEELPQLLDLADGVLLTGSPSNVHPSHFGEAVHDPSLPLDEARDGWTLPLIREALARGIPLFGICRGAQETNVALGGTLHQAVHEVDGLEDHRPSSNTDAAVQYGPAHTIDVQPGGLLQQLDLPARFAVNSVHGQGVKQLASGLRVEALRRTASSKPSRSRARPVSTCACNGTPNGRPRPTPFRCACSPLSGWPASATAKGARRCPSDDGFTEQRGKPITHERQRGPSWCKERTSHSASWNSGSTRTASPRSNAWCLT